MSSIFDFHMNFLYIYTASRSTKIKCLDLPDSSQISKQELTAPLISVCFLAVGSLKNKKSLDWRSPTPSP